MPVSSQFSQLRTPLLQRRRHAIYEASAHAGAGPESPPFDPSESLLDPRLEPRDEAVFLLTAAAEVEHALMVQYLFAAYSIRTDSLPGTAEIQEQLIQIAREEMGHLATVQNL